MSPGWGWCLTLVLTKPVDAVCLALTLTINPLIHLTRLDPHNHDPSVTHTPLPHTCPAAAGATPCGAVLSPSSDGGRCARRAGHGHGRARACHPAHTSASGQATAGGSGCSVGGGSCQIGRQGGNHSAHASRNGHGHARRPPARPTSAPCPPHAPRPANVSAIGQAGGGGPACRVGGGSCQSGRQGGGHCTQASRHGRREGLAGRPGY
jgi:hypothetical protein